jgi:hypothetical protein
MRTSSFKMIILAGLISSCTNNTSKLEKETFELYSSIYKNKDYSAKIFAECYASKFKSYEDYEKSESNKRARVSVECGLLIKPANRQDAFDKFGFGYSEFMEKYAKHKGNSTNSLVIAQAAEKLYNGLFGRTPASHLNETKQSLYFLGCAMANFHVSEYGDKDIAKKYHPKNTKEWCHYDEIR